tara:strand:- start:3376 stop:4122 length:747 start_codon:yes stop_codon:yes gene_type:complete
MIKLTLLRDKYEGSCTRYLEPYYPDNLTISTQVLETIACVKVFLRIQISNYNSELIKSSNINYRLKVLGAKIVDYRDDYWRYGGNHEPYSPFCKYFVNSMIRRLKLNEIEKRTVVRRMDNAFGSFDKSLNPKMLQEIRLWWNKKYPRRKIERGAKEDILRVFSEKKVNIDAEFCSKFIMEVSPMKFIKYWGIKSNDENGKRRTNDVLRELLKKEFYRRERNYLRVCFCAPNLRRLPLNIEKRIREYLY